MEGRSLKSARLRTNERTSERRRAPNRVRPAEGCAHLSLLACIRRSSCREHRTTFPIALKETKKMALRMNLASVSRTCPFFLFSTSSWTCQSWSYLATISVFYCPCNMNTHPREKYGSRTYRSYAQKARIVVRRLSESLSYSTQLELPSAP